jgi:peptidoglycan hydrolase CwlO-like protein
MEVSMDGLRKRLAQNYNSLTRKLNKSIEDTKSYNGSVTLSIDEIQREIDGLKTGIATLLAMYQEGEGFDYLDILLEDFNPEEE